MEQILSISLSQTVPSASFCVKSCPCHLEELQYLSQGRPKIWCWSVQTYLLSAMQLFSPSLKEMFFCSVIVLSSFPDRSAGKKKKKKIFLQCRRYRRSRFDPWVRKIPWRWKWPLTPVFLSGKSHDQRSLVGCSPKGRKDSDTTVPIGMLYISMTEKVLCAVFSLQLYQTLVVPYFCLSDRSSKWK